VPSAPTGGYLVRAPYKARLRNVMLRLVPERLFDRGMRRFFDAERPLADIPALER